MTDDPLTDGGTDGAIPDALGDDLAEPSRDEPPENAIADVSDFAHERDANGDLLPVTQQVPGTDRYVRVRPIRQGEANEYLPENGDPRGMDDDEILDLFHEFVVEPDLSGVETLDSFYAFGVDPLLFAIMQASGFDMAKGMLTENSELTEAIKGNSSRGN